MFPPPSPSPDSRRPTLLFPPSVRPARCSSACFACPCDHAAPSWVCVQQGSLAQPDHSLGSRCTPAARSQTPRSPSAKRALAARPLARSRNPERLIACTRSAKGRRSGRWRRQSPCARRPARRSAGSAAGRHCRLVQECTKACVHAPQGVAPPKGTPALDRRPLPASALLTC